MFRLIELSSGQIQNIVPVHSVSARIMGFHTVYVYECTSTMFCIWPDDGSVSRNMSSKF